MSKKIDCEYTSNIICPYCGYEDRDSWESTGSDGEEDETDCGKCERPFGYRTEITVDYTSWKLKP